MAFAERSAVIIVSSDGKLRHYLCLCECQTEREDEPDPRQAALAASILNLDSEEQAGQENNLSCYIYTEVFADFMDLCVINCHMAGGALSLPSVGLFSPLKC